MDKELFLKKLRRGYEASSLPEKRAEEDAFLKLAKMTEILLETNRSFNLTAIREEDEVIEKHLIDSLCLMKALPEDLSGKKLLDIGAGAGFPSFPLAVLCPELSVTALEASEKKCSYLKKTAEELGLTRFTVLCGRAEEKARETGHEYDFVSSRALSSYRIFLELGCRYVAPGGRILAMKGPAGDAEREEAATAMKKLGFSPEETVFYSLPFGGGERRILCARKTRPTPDEYPRVYPKILKKPL